VTRLLTPSKRSTERPLSALATHSGCRAVVAAVKCRALPLLSLHWVTRPAAFVMTVAVSEASSQYSMPDSGVPYPLGKSLSVPLLTVVAPE